MKDTTQAILLVADISGYTQFMRLHSLNTSHAKQVIVRLMKSIIRASKPPLKLAELEGDAVFFYAMSSAENLKTTAELVKRQVLELFSSFNDERSTLEQMEVCDCDACLKASDLKLKQVIHLGDVAIEKIERFEKLYGLDVIVVHRMLKNSVPSNEYVMMTKPVYTNFENFYGLEPERRSEKLEGIGEVETMVFYPSHLASSMQAQEVKTPSPPKLERLSWKLKLACQTFLDLYGIRKIRGVFSNLPAS